MFSRLPVTPPAPALSALTRVARPTWKQTRQQITHLATLARRSALVAPLDTGGFLGASVATWASTSPSLIPRTRIVTATNTGLSQSYGYAVGWLAARGVRLAGRALGISLTVSPSHRARARLLGAAALTVMTSYSAVRGALRQREISTLVHKHPRPFHHHLVGMACGTGGAASLLLAARATTVTARFYGRVLSPVLPRFVVPVASIALTAVTVRAIVYSVRHRLFARAVEQADRANAFLSPEIPQPTVPERSGSPDSSEPWTSLGAAGRRVVSGGASREVIDRVVGETLGFPAREPIRVYASAGHRRSVAGAVESVMRELDRTGAWERRHLVLFTGTGTGWLQEWSLSAVEFLTGGDCATASIQYSFYPSGLSFLAQRALPQEAGQRLFAAVSERLATMPADSRPKLYVAGESLGAFGGQSAFADPQDMLNSVDGAVWTGTPGITPMWKQLTASRRAGSPEIAPVIDGGRHIRFVTQPQDLTRDFYGGLYEPWESPKVVYVQHASDPVVWWGTHLLTKEPTWMRERVGFDVTSVIRWYPWITFWQIAADMPLSTHVPGGYGHAYHDEMVAVWAAVLDADPGLDLDQIRHAIRTCARGIDTTA